MASDNLVHIASGNGLSPDRQQAITWSDVDLLSIGSYGRHFNEILFEIQKLHLRKHIWAWSVQNIGHFVQASMC